MLTATKPIKLLFQEWTEFNRPVGEKGSVLESTTCKYQSHSVMTKSFPNKISYFRNAFTGTLPGGTSCINSNLVRKPKREKMRF